MLLVRPVGVVAVLPGSGEAAGALVAVLAVVTRVLLVVVLLVVAAVLWVQGFVVGLVRCDG